MSTAAKTHASLTDTPQAHVAHHFHTASQQFEAAVQGMWIFLATEILLFSGLFCAYAVFRTNHPEVFEYAHQFLSKPLGAINTVILLCSSFTMAAAVWASQHGRRRTAVALLCLTLLGGFGFLGIKFVEYEHKWKEGLLWGIHYQRHAENASAAAEAPAVAFGEPAAPAAGSASENIEAATAETGEPDPAFRPASLGPPGLRRTAASAAPRTEQQVHNVQTFFGVYFLMTGLHGLHVIAGMALIAWVAWRALKGAFSPAYFTPVAMVGLYWHLVDVIWIYLFPLLYLIH